MKTATLMRSLALILSTLALALGVSACSTTGDYPSQDSFTDIYHGNDSDR